MKIEKLTYLKRFSPDTELIKWGDLSEDDIRTLPAYWREALSEPLASNRCKAVLAAWKNYDYQFESTRLYLTDNLLDIELIERGRAFSLLYSIKNTLGGVAYYEGKNPLTKKIPVEIQPSWGMLPLSITKLYDGLHNGWCYFASQSNGLSPVEELFLLSDRDWGILNEIDLASLPFKL
ncbi:MAG: hypothetical protein LBV38_07085 [Alistipes sp.]|nr:hypothetical protein [Alistipes sp.]